MSSIVDARGLSCPQPVLMTLNEIKNLNRGEVVIIVDTDTSMENVSRAAKTQGWQVIDTQAEGDGYRVTIKKD
jgi:tRNA 2-thiouridine synthesizing protein A